METVFRRIGVDEARLLLNAEADVFDNPIELERARGFLGDARNILIVAMEDDRVIGQIAAMVHLHVDAPADLYIDNLGVAPHRQRQGIASQLIKLALAAGRECGAETSWIAVDPENFVAHEVYRKTGATAAPIVMFSYPKAIGRGDV